MSNISQSFIYLMGLSTTSLTNLMILVCLITQIVVVSVVLWYLTIRPVARKGYGSIAHEAKPNGLLTRGP